MNLPLPRETLAGCVWLPRIIAKARLVKNGALEAEYASRFCHPTGVDAQFLAFFRLTKEEILAICEASEDEVATWFGKLDTGGARRIEDWNHLALNLGRKGYPMEDRLPIALAMTYRHLGSRDLQTVFEVLEADEEPSPDDLR